MYAIQQNVWPVCLGNQIDFGTGLGIVGLERGGLEVVVEKFNDRSKRAT